MTTELPKHICVAWVALYCNIFDYLRLIVIACAATAFTRSRPSVLRTLTTHCVVCCGTVTPYGPPAVSKLGSLCIVKPLTCNDSIKITKMPLTSIDFFLLSVAKDCSAVHFLAN